MAEMESADQGPRWKILLAFGIIYFVWGSTFFAIRVGVSQVPPFLLAAMRFLAAGLLVFGWAAARGERRPTGRQWISATVLAFLIFVVDYGLLFWAEQRVPSGIAAVILATIPAFMALSEILLLRTQKLTVRLAGALLAGIAGVAVLTSHSINFGALGRLGGTPIDTAGAVALIIGAISWSVASSLSRKFGIPDARGWRLVGPGRGSSSRRTSELSPLSGFRSGVDRPALSRFRRIHCRVHRLRLAAAS
jgi:drug/metabolite transporter (DMT)-like permease